MDDSYLDARRRLIVGAAVQLAIAAPLIGLALAALSSTRPRPRTSPAKSAGVAAPVVVQRGETNAQLLVDNARQVPAGAEPTATPGVYLASDGWDPSVWPGLVTVGRVGDDDVLVDITQAGVLTLGGDAVAAQLTLRAVWSELRWPAESHELEVVGVEGVALPGLATIPWSHAITRIERGPERSRPLIVLAVAPPTGDDAVRLEAARPSMNAGVLLTGDWPSIWRLVHSNGSVRLEPLGLDLDPLTPTSGPRLNAPEAPPALADTKPAEGVSVSVLGRLEVSGVSLSEKETELASFLALHPNGATEAQIRTALWPEREVPRGTFNNLVSATRRHLGTTLDGDRLLAHCHKGLYRLHPSVACDLVDLETAVHEAGDGHAGTGSLIGCLTAMRGRPFEACKSDWPFDDGLVARAEAVVARAARLVATAAPQAGVHASIGAVVSALGAVPDPSIEDALRELRVGLNPHPSRSVSDTVPTHVTAQPTSPELVER